MGRKKKYHTVEEKKIAQSNWYKNWYDKNKKQLNFNRMQKYYDKKNNNNGLFEDT
jgi:hypothetical protein